MHKGFFLFIGELIECYFLSMGTEWGQNCFWGSIVRIASECVEARAVLEIYAMLPLLC